MRLKILKTLKTFLNDRFGQSSSFFHGLIVFLVENFSEIALP